MGTVVAYTCDRCPLAFEVGEYACWDSPGHTVKAVCGGCGTMHRLECERGACRVLALPGPIRSLPLVERESAWDDGRRYYQHEWPYAESDWQSVAEVAADPDLGRVTCGQCGVVGQLVSLSQINVAGREVCPVCGGSLAAVYIDTVN